MINSTSNDGVVRVVLHRLNGKLCTHLENIQCGGFSGGHYFNEGEELLALKDFVERCERYKVIPIIRAKPVMTAETADKIRSILASS